MFWDNMFWDKWFKPKKTTSWAATTLPKKWTYVSKAKPQTYRPSVVTSKWKPPTAQKTTGAIGGTIAKATSLWQRATQRTPQAAQLAPGVYKKATSYALAQPTAPASMAWARTLPSGATSDAMRRQMAYHADLQAAGITPAEMGRRVADVNKWTREAQGILGAPPTQGYREGAGYVPYEEGMPRSYQEQLARARQAQGLLGRETIPQVEGRYAPEMFGAPREATPTQPSFMDTLGKWLRGEPPTAAQPGVGIGALAQPTPYPWQRGVSPTGVEGQPTVPPEAPAPPTGPAGLAAGEEAWRQVYEPAGMPAPPTFETLTEEQQTAQLTDVLGRIEQGVIRPEHLAMDPELNLNTNWQMLNTGVPPAEFLASLDGEYMVSLASAARESRGLLDRLDIPQDYLTNLIADDEWSYSSLHDMGYKSEEFLQRIGQSWAAVELPLPVEFDQAALKGLPYGDVKALTSKLQFWQDNPEYWQYWEDQGVVRLELESVEVGFDDKGNPVYDATWRQIIDYKKQDKVRQEQGDEQWLHNQERYQEWYWSQEQIDNRQKEREEYYNWQHEKELEGWEEYYTVLEGLQLDPLANEHFDNSAMFAKLRREWETTGADVPWSDWLSSFDFEGEWYSMAPQRRGERAGVMAPRLKRLTY